MDATTTNALLLQTLTSIIANGPVTAVLVGCVIHLYIKDRKCSEKYERLMEELARTGCIQEGCPRKFEGIERRVAVSTSRSVQ